MTTLTITVTKDILERSKNCLVSSEIVVENCAIALAVRGVFPKARVYVHTLAFFGDEIQWLTPYNSVTHSQDMRDYIRLFDASDRTDISNLPQYSFDIEIPDKVLESINIEELKPLLENHPNLKLVTA